MITDIFAAQVNPLCLEESNSSTATIVRNNTYCNPIRNSDKRSRALGSIELARNRLLDCLPD